MNIAIDGPAGAGKSTVAKAVAEKTGTVYVNTGAMYRAMGLYILRLGIRPEDSGAIEKAADSADISIRYVNGFQHVFLNGEDVTGSLREEAVGNMASVCSANAEVRRRLVELQQKLAKETSVVMDGRDIGTVVLPDAELKIYLTADPHIRALRRYRELEEKGTLGGETLESIENDIEERDFRDMNRANSPLKKAGDAVEVDSSGLTADEVVDKILELVREREDH